MAKKEKKPGKAAELEKAERPAPVGEASQSFERMSEVDPILRTKKGISQGGADENAYL